MLVYIIKLSADYSRLKTKLETTEKAISQMGDNSTRKFEELYNSRNKTNETLVELTTTIKLLVSSMDEKFNSFNNQFEKLERKIDDMKEDK